MAEPARPYAPEARRCESNAQAIAMLPNLLSETLRLREQNEALAAALREAKIILSQHHSACMGNAINGYLSASARQPYIDAAEKTKAVMDRASAALAHRSEGA